MKYLVTPRDRDVIITSSDNYEKSKRVAEDHAKKYPGEIFDVFEIKASAMCKVLDPFIIEVVK